MRKFFILCICLCLSVRVMAADAFVQTHFDAIFWVDDDAQTVTAAYGIGFMTSDTRPRDWLFALPPGAEIVGTGPGMLPTLLNAETEYTPYPGDYSRYCDLSPDFSRLEGYGWAAVAFHEVPLLAAPERVSATEAASILPTSDDAIGSYSREGWSFVRMTLQPQPEARAPVVYASAFVQRSPLLVVRYPGVTPLLPLGLHAPDMATIEDEFYTQRGSVRTTVSIFADSSYTGDALTTLDFSQARGRHMIAEAMQLTTRPIEAPQKSLELYFNALNRANGFIRMWAGAPPTINDFLRERHPDVVMLYDERLAPVLTRFDSSLQLPVDDVSFTSQGHVPEGVERYPTPADFNPLTYWGCTTRTLFNPLLEARLPSGRTYLPEPGMVVPHPREWMMSDVEGQIVFAPEQVNRQMLAQIEQGSGTFPALIISTQSRSYPLEEPFDGLPDDVWISLTEAAIFPDYLTWLYFPERIPPAVFDRDTGRGLSFEGVVVGIFESDANIGQSEMYADMIRYIETRQYMTAPDLRHTLYLGHDGYAAAIGYPGGWQESADEETVLLLPDGASYADAPAIRLTYTAESASETVQDTVRAFTAEGRRGYLVTTGVPHWSIAEISAPAALYDAYADLLRHLADSLRPHDAVME